VLDAVYRSHGAAVAVSDEEILAALRRLARTEGILPVPKAPPRSPLCLICLSAARCSAKIPSSSSTPAAA
jgi:hypothetical protein